MAPKAAVNLGRVMVIFSADTLLRERLKTPALDYHLTRDLGLMQHIVGTGFQEHGLEKTAM